MSTIAATTTNNGKIPSLVTTLWSFSSNTSSDTCEALELTGGDRSVQFVGTVTATVVIEGSNDGSTYATLTDPLGNALSFTAAGMKQISELTRYVRPRISSGTTGTGCKCYLVERGC